MPPIVVGHIVRVHFEDGEHAARELTLEVERPDGTTYFIVVAIDRMTEGMAPTAETPVVSSARDR